jgi:hypothetical protein
MPVVAAMIVSAPMVVAVASAAVGPLAFGRSFVLVVCHRNDSFSFFGRSLPSKASLTSPPAGTLIRTWTAMSENRVRVAD